MRATPSLDVPRIVHERLTCVASGTSAGGRAFQERREPVHGGFAQTSLFATILKSPPPGRDSADREWHVPGNAYRCSSAGSLRRDRLRMLPARKWCAVRELADMRCPRTGRQCSSIHERRKP